MQLASRKLVPGIRQTRSLNMSIVLKKVLITDEVDPQCSEILKKNGIDVTVDTSLAKDKTKLIAEIPVSSHTFSFQIFELDTVVINLLCGQQCMAKIDST